MADSSNSDYLDGLPDLPDRPMTLQELRAFYELYQTEVLKRFPKGSDETRLRTNGQKRLLEGWQAYFFGSIFGRLFGCREILTIHVREQRETVWRDALMEWKNGGKVQQVNLQLKELVSPDVNPKSGTAEEELQKILNKLPKKYHNSPDVQVAIFTNYGNTRLTTVVEPDKLNIGALWFFGFSKPESTELFLIGGKRPNEHNYRLTWRHLPE